MVGDDDWFQCGVGFFLCCDQIGGVVDWGDGYVIGCKVVCDQCLFQIGSKLWCLVVGFVYVVECDYFFGDVEVVGCGGLC